MTKELVDDSQRFIWHLTVEKYGSEREFTFISVEWFNDAYEGAKAFLAKRHPNKLKDDPRFAGDDEGDRYVRECPHDSELFIVALKRGHELSSTEESVW